VEGADGKVLYVWLDAPIGYISATKQWAKDNGKDWEPYWKDEDTRLLHFIGKDNIVFHCIIFPILLKAHGDYILPQNVPANEFLNLEGDKLSTSRNWAVWLHEFLEVYPDRKDAMRYTLCSILPENKDSEFTWADFQARNNNELVAILGNFVNRAVVLTHKYFDGVIPDAGFDEEFLTQNLKTYKTVGDHLDKFQFRQALAEAMNLARAGNKYLADNEPWKTIKTDEDAAKRVIGTSLQIAAHLTNVLAPFLPFTCQKLKHILAFENDISWEGNEAVLLAGGHTINKAELLFSRFEDEDVANERAKLEAASKKNQVVEHAPIKPNIQFEDFEGMDLRIGTITEAQKVPKTSKLLQLQVDIGSEVRTVVSGIAESYKPEEIIGQQVLLLTNLAPRKIRGVESQGMILMAENSDGKLSFMQPDKTVDSGSGVS
jgi:methionyl-tRNA synthetase